MPAAARSRVAAAVPVVACLVLAACSVSTDVDRSTGFPSTPATTPPADATPPPAVRPILAPLTGVPTTAATAARPAVAVPITAGSVGPPSGLGHADIVYAVWDGAAGVRLAALFQSQDDVAVGPVAGLRPEDAKLLPVAHPVVAAASSYDKFLRMGQAAGLNIATTYAHPEAYRQSTTGAAYASTPGLRALAASGTLPPPNLFPLAAPDQPLAQVGLHPVSRLSVPSASHPVFIWTWDATVKRWRATVGGATVTAANVVVLAMPFRTVLAHYPQGPPLPTADVFGAGNAYAISAGHGAAGRWARSGPLKLTTVATADGVPMRFTAGPTWVIIIPVGNAWSVS